MKIVRGFFFRFNRPHENFRYEKKKLKQAEVTFLLQEQD